MADDKDKKIGEVPHLTEVTGTEKIPVSANGEPRYVEVGQIVEKAADIKDVQATPKNNQVIYITYNSQKIIPYAQDNIISNEYYPSLGYGVITVSSFPLNIPMWFQNNQNVERIVFPRTLTSTSVSKQAFKGCTNLKSVILPTAITKLNSECFKNCVKLEYLNININKNISIDGECFYGCQKLKIKDIPKIGGSGAFYGCTSLEEVVIAEYNLDYQDIFYGCTNLRRISIQINSQPSNRTFYNVAPEYIDTIGSNIIYYPIPKNLKELYLRYDGIVANLDTYIGTPNNWLKIYVPTDKFEAYLETYPSLKGYIHPFTGEDIYALKSDSIQSNALKFRRLESSTKVV